MQLWPLGVKLKKTLIFLLVVFSIFLVIIFRPTPVTTIHITGFEEEEKRLIEKYPDKKAYTLEELNQREAEINALNKKKIEKWKKENNH